MKEIRNRIHFLLSIDTVIDMLWSQFKNEFHDASEFVWVRVDLTYTRKKSIWELNTEHSLIFLFCFIIKPLKQYVFPTIMVHTTVSITDQIRLVNLHTLFISYSADINIFFGMFSQKSQRTHLSKCERTMS